jgi:hypothetical protein
LVTHARDHWWTLDFANASLSPRVNSRAELVPSPRANGRNGAPRRRARGLMSSYKNKLSFHSCLDFSWNNQYIDVKISVKYCFSLLDKHHRYVVIFSHFPHKNGIKTVRFYTDILVYSFLCGHKILKYTQKSL